MEQYKGEVPSNVVDPAKKQDKPYYKKVGFWVAIGLMVFGIGCSIFGAIQGARYAKAVERAAQTIVGARNDDDGLAVSAKPLHFANDDEGNPVACVDLGSLSWAWGATSNGNYEMQSRNIRDYVLKPSSPSELGQIVCGYYDVISANSAYRETMGISLDTGGTICVYDPSYNTAQSTTAFKTSMDGVYLYFRLADGVSYQTAEEYFTSMGYSDGYEEGYSSGYSNGFDAAYRDVSQSIELLYNPSLSVTNPVVTYNVSVDGAVVASGNLEGGNEASQRFTYGRQPQSVVTITLESSYRFWLAWSKGEAIDPSSFNSITYADPVYIPTYWDDALFEVVSFTEATPARTFYTLVFDPAHNADSPIGDYSLGYRDGYADGTNYGYSSGVAVGSSDGYSNGYTMGFEAGRTDALTNDNVLAGMFVTAFQQPFNQLYRFLNFNLLGVNFLALFTAFITVSIGLVVIKKVL